MSSASPMHEKWILLQMLPLNHWGEIRCPQLLISGPGVPWHRPPCLRSLHAPEQLEGTLGLPQSSRRGDQCPNPELGLTKRCPQGAPSSEDTTKCPFTPSGRGGTVPAGGTPQGLQRAMQCCTPSSRGVAGSTRRPPRRARGQKTPLHLLLGEGRGPAHPPQAPFRASPWLCSHLHSHAQVVTQTPPWPPARSSQPRRGGAGARCVSMQCRVSRHHGTPRVEQAGPRPGLTVPTGACRTRAPAVSRTHALTPSGWRAPGCEPAPPSAHR